jgi:flavin reductase (DIM6/NTAB) family NADH-FMN oxidoreductase RutF
MRRTSVNEDAKKTALRMIPYGLYVLTAEGQDGAIAAATVNWVTQTAFEPPLVVVGVKTDSGAHALIKQKGTWRARVLRRLVQRAAPHMPPRCSDRVALALGQGPMD